jgi:hypothetical protein
MPIGRGRFFREIRMSFAGCIFGQTRKSENGAGPPRVSYLSLPEVSDPCRLEDVARAKGSPRACVPHRPLATVPASQATTHRYPID